MGFNNPSVPWSELEKQLSGRRSPKPARPPVGEWANGGDSPAWSHHRPPYAELHCHSNFSFLDGASHPEELAEEAARLGLEALALTDHNGFYGVVRFSEAARKLGLPTVFGAELTLGADAPRSGADGVPGPGGAHLVVLARSPEGYARLARVISQAQMAGR